MFSSTSNTATVNPFQYLSSSSSHNPFPFTVDQETNDFFLYNHNPLTVPFIPTNPSTTTNNSTAETLMINMAASANSAMLPSKLQDHVAVLNGDHHGQYNPCNFLPRKKPVKKHSHSKISTAQGLRDRRVRLSIEIARKFFDLQDMLGFDKASKTLEWLLSKSRKAIKELSQNGSQDAGAKSLSSSSTCDEVVSETVGDPEAEVVVSKSETSVAVDTEKKMKKPQKTTVDLLAKEMRAKARARARERTRVKMCNRRVHESRKCPDSNPQILNPSRPLTQQHQASDKSAGSYIQNINSSSSSKGVAAHVHGAEEPSPHHSLAIHVPKGNVVQESIVIKRKTKPSAAAIMGYQQNVVMLKDVSCSNSSMNNYLPNLPLPNWDINGTIARSSFCAITNMNLSAGFQLCGKLLEGENNQYHQ